jgi:hypothetical protein
MCQGGARVSTSNMLLLFPVISFLVYCPVLCYLDWKYRDIKTHDIWMPLVATNLPVLFAAYILGLYSPVFVALSFVAVVLWFIVMRAGILPGGDFMWLSLISVFVVLNPFTKQPFMLMFSFYLIGMTIAAYWGVLVDNLIQKHTISLKMEQGLPYLIPISAAFVAAVFL